MDYKIWKRSLMRRKKEEIIDVLFKKIKQTNVEKGIIRSNSENRLVVMILLRKNLMFIRDSIDYIIKHPYSRHIGKMKNV